MKLFPIRTLAYPGNTRHSRVTRPCATLFALCLETLPDSLAPTRELSSLPPPPIQTRVNETVNETWARARRNRLFFNKLDNLLIVTQFMLCVPYSGVNCTTFASVSSISEKYIFLKLLFFVCTLPASSLLCHCLTYLHASFLDDSSPAIQSGSNCPSQFVASSSLFPLFLCLTSCPPACKKTNHCAWVMLCQVPALCYLVCSKEAPLPYYDGHCHCLSLFYVAYSVVIFAVFFEGLAGLT